MLSFFNHLLADRKKLAVFLMIFFFGLFSKLPRLSQPENFYFDEVYHGFTATVYLHGDKVAYDVWAKPPQGLAYEWTHPPMAKLLMAGMMLIFGENSLGWRIGSVLTGTAAAVLVAILAFELFSSMNIALLSMFFLSAEGLFFVQSRIAMNDAYFVFFMLIGLVYYVKWKKHPDLEKYLYLSGVGMGLALATKWTALYVMALLCLDLLRDLFWKKKPLKSFPILHLFFAFCVLPFLLYIFSYGQLFYLGGSLEDFIALQKQMWYYHTGLSATHAYSSKPWQWLLNIKPVWMFADYAIPGKVSHIYNLGNSVILYTGLWAVFSTLFKEKKALWSWEKWFVIIIYFGPWLPWIFSPRIMLFYHYMPALPGLCIMLARWLAPKLEMKKNGGAKIILAAAFIWFVIFYPVMTGFPVPRAWGDFVYRILST